MLFLLRNIRRKLLTNNKVTTYLLYAVGEIILVMIGILLAVQIDEWNEGIQTEKRIENILKEIQVDLSTDIEFAIEVLAWYNRKDSLIRLALAGELSYDDYKNDHSRNSIRYLTFGADHFKIHDNGYKKLMAHSDNLDVKYQNLLSLLNEMYVYQKYEVDKFDERMDVLTDEFYDNASRNIPNFHSIRLPEVDDELINYFLHDPYYKNELLNYQNSAIRSYSLWIINFSRSAQDAYIMIRQLLADTTLLPIFIPQNRIVPSQESIDTFRGTYIIGENSLNMETFPLYIESNEDQLYTFFGNRDNKRRTGFINENLLDAGLGYRISLDTVSPSSTVVLDFRSTVLDAKFYKIE